jgi:outer membrane biogenesis lipoprotein LolB
MKRIAVLLAVVASSMLSACAMNGNKAQQYADQHRSMTGGFCPPTQAVKGIC